MIVVKDIAEMRQQVKLYRISGKTIGLVPTMGYLHEGHIALVKKCKEEVDIVIVSIFINPAQFNNINDLKNYPIDIDSDTSLLQAEGIDILFSPSREEMYPSLPTSNLFFGDLSLGLEGEFRPNHFSGVGLIISKLFNIILPDKAYFGLKDLQQFMVVRALVSEFNFDVDVVGVPTVRSESGLALSSRNARLNNQGKNYASMLYGSLMEAKNLLEKGEEVSMIESAISRKFASLDEIELEYFTVVNPSTFKRIETYSSDSDVALCIAAFVQGVRLIDNIYLRRQ
ncbi:MAG: pantoate--beta-alanine ligase [Cyclobacteriaceae bacterium]|jgi:pantoate--beta-alanine ligase